MCASADLGKAKRGAPRMLLKTRVGKRLLCSIIYGRRIFLRLDYL